MKAPRAHIWALLLAAAFLMLWCVSVGVTFASSSQELPVQTAGSPAFAEDAQGIRVIGILGWCLVAVGFLGVALTAAFGGRPRKRRKATRVSRTAKRPYKVIRSVYSPPPFYRYHRNIERRW